MGEEYISHYGVKRRSGRYPWGSGKNPRQRNKDKTDWKKVRELVKEARKKLSPKKIAEARKEYRKKLKSLKIEGKLSPSKNLALFNSHAIMDNMRFQQEVMNQNMIFQNMMNINNQTFMNFHSTGMGFF